MSLNPFFFQIYPHEHPESIEFKPLIERSPMEQVRWWALVANRLARQERALYTRSEESRFPEVAFDLWRMLKEIDNGADFQRA